ncbi:MULTISPECIES: hypothetical protein [Chryseobacterium]|uniref:hypothetical protein n=1 Tax=Chryseobacterium TaxID=59732 RepID=UPI001EF895DF|nr:MULTISPECIES: hypothetical protein [Chryseobacterium]MBM7418525.1 hypothetical protein [Chryseobacterium sp. JUb44]MDH6208434.1 hypothetical protein [Chryseobacterium sp. BIGb0186]WSO11326.1 hypothetical protein VUJ64_05280 [Chryseobacterium scophthalmum]
MSNDKFQDKYNEVFQSLKEEKMNWDFEDFLQKAEGSEISADEAAIIPIQSKKPSLLKWFWMAASAVILLSVGFLFNDNQNREVADQAKLVENEIQKQKNDFINENHNPNSQVAVHITDSVSGPKQDSIFVDNSIAEKDVLDEILSKKSRIKKESKPRYVDNSGLKNKTFKDSIGYKDSYVIVNGKRIDNMEEAINVTKYSFQVVANNVNQALAPKVMDNVDY